MQTSQDRILTPHVGSLPRSAAVTDVVFAQEQGKNPDNAATIIRDAVDDVVKQQVATGVDIVSDGEMSKIRHRLIHCLKHQSNSLTLTNIDLHLGSP